MNLSVARVVGYFSLPSPSLAEANPTAYSLAMADAPSGAGSCAHCGTGILHHVIIECEGERAFIGTTCAERIGGEVARCVSDRLTSAERATRDAARDAKRSEDEARSLAFASKLAAIGAKVADLADMLADGRDGFCDSVARDLRRGVIPSGRGLTLACEIIAKRSGRAGSKAYYAAYEAIEARLEAASVEYNALYA